jgi:hypothetical protein
MLAQLRNPSLLPKIMELEQALFFNSSPSILKLPVSIVNVMHVDEVGQAWFMVQRPTQHISEFDREFEARLELFKKGKDFHMQVSGKACLVIDPEEINNATHLPLNLKSELSSNMVLVKLKVKDIQYYPHLQKQPLIKMQLPALPPLTFFKTLQYIVKDVFPVFQSH